MDVDEESKELKEFVPYKDLNEADKKAVDETKSKIKNCESNIKSEVNKLDMDY